MPFFALPVRFSCRIVDELNIEARAVAYALVDPSSSFGSLQSYFADWLTAIDNCSDGQIVASEMTLLPALTPGLKTAPVAGGRVSQTGILNFHATGSPRRWAEAIPALSNSTGVITGVPPKIVQSTGSPIQTLYALLLTTGSSVIEFTNDNQQPLASFSDSLITFWKYNRQLAAATFEYLPGYPE